MSIKTCESVTPMHPDKRCDFIADAVLDAFLIKDKNARVAVEIMGGHNSISISGEVTSKAEVDIKKVVQNIVGRRYHVHQHLVKQSPFIARGVDTGGAGDQGIMKGFACSDTDNFMPLEYELARDLCRKIYKKYPVDGKTQVTIDMDGRGSKRAKILTVVASFQNTSSKALLKLVKSFIKSDEYLINPAGEWKLGGFDADSGLSGRKLVVDSYGPDISIGGGSFSGKDCTKVDRSGAYMARKIAVDYLRKHKASRVYTQLAYAIGKAQPVAARAIVDRQEMEITGYNLTPVGIKKLLKLDRPIYKKTALWGHFGNNYLWDK